MRRALAHGKEVTKETLYEELNNMNGDNAYVPGTTTGPVTFSKDDRQGVDKLQIYRATGGVFKAVGEPFASEYMNKI